MMGKFMQESGRPMPIYFQKYCDKTIQLNTQDMDKVTHPTQFNALCTLIMLYNAENGNSSYEDVSEKLVNWAVKNKDAVIKFEIAASERSYIYEFLSAR